MKLLIKATLLVPRISLYTVLRAPFRVLLYVMLQLYCDAVYARQLQFAKAAEFSVKNAGGIELHSPLVTTVLYTVIKTYTVYNSRSCAAFDITFLVIERTTHMRTIVFLFVKH